MTHADSRGRFYRRPVMLLLLAGLTACAAQTGQAPARPAAGATAAQPGAAPAVPAVPDQDFDTWLRAFKTEALAKGIARRTLDGAFAGVTPNPRVVELDRRQPEGRITFSRYYENTVPPRIERGRRMLAENAEVLSRVAGTYGVPSRVVVALWGVETSFGVNQGKFSIVRSLATLAYEGRRAEFFRGELLNALTIMDQEGFSSEKMVGSWAGAMGQCQFMPSSYLKWAVDFDGDGHRDIWATRADVFASAANYLKQNGWVPGEGWGRRVAIPANLPRGLTGLETRKTLAEWQALGVRLPGGADLPAAEMTASLINPGDEGNHWLVYENFRVIMRWNRSTYFAMSVLSLADEIGR
ncbi:lytic murein transglycosylase [Zavarzinia compransoris]|nr:lytic murein transglycosylase [Zavarzinia compransoris]